MKTILLHSLVGHFAENKDIARDIRSKEIIPALDHNEEVVVDFEKVNSATKSFIHALISDLIRKYGIQILDKVAFKNCNETIQKLIGIVVDYMQEAE